MTLKPLLASVALILLLSSFHSNGKLDGKLKTIYMARWGDTLTYHYDDQGRISQITSNKGYQSEYEYKANIIVERTKDGSTVTMYLNSKGLVDSLTDIDPGRTSTTSLDANGLPNVTQRGGVRRVFPYSGQHLLSFDGLGTNPKGMAHRSKKFVYDDKGYLIDEKEYVEGQLQFTSKITVENGNISSYLVKNLLKDTVTSINPKTMKEEIKVIAYNDELYKVKYLSGSTNSLMQEDFFGKGPKELVSQKLDYFLPISGDSTISSFKYTFDSRKRVSTLIKSVKSTDPPPYNSDAAEADTCYFTYY